MAVVIRFIIVNAGSGLYYTGDKLHPYVMWIHRIPKDLIFKTYEEAETKIGTIQVDDHEFFQIEKIYRVSK